MCFQLTQKHQLHTKAVLTLSSISLLRQSFLDVIIELEKLDIVSPERVDSIEKCLRDIGRVDLAKKVSAYKMSGDYLTV